MTVMLLLSFSCGFFLDLAWAYYIQAVADRKTKAAVLTSMLIGASGLLAVMQVVSSPVMAIPYVLGLGAGTWWVVR